MITLSGKQLAIIVTLLGGNIVTSAMQLGGYKAEFEQMKAQVISDQGARDAFREELIKLRVTIADLQADVKILSARVK
jgi:hypothetical protein